MLTSDRLNPFVFRAYYCAGGSLKASDQEASQSLCFQGVLLRAVCARQRIVRQVSIPLFSGRITAPGGSSSKNQPKVSQSLCFQGVLLRGDEKLTEITEICLNPFVFRAYYCGAVWLVVLGGSGLNPFVFRAYYCG